MNNISPLAHVSPNAVLGDNIEVGPFAFIDDDVQIGDGCKIHPHAMIYRYVRMGRNCQIFPGAVVGAIPQDLKKASGKFVTRIGSNTLIMSYVHIAHDCVIGNNCILTSYVGIAGETEIDDWAILGGGSKAHQFSKVGCHAMVGGMSKINKDIPPYVLCGREPICFAGVNIVGLRRRGFSSDVIRNIKDIYDTIYFSGYNISDGCAKVEAGFPQSEERDTILNFVKASKRGIIRAYDNKVKGEID